MTETTVYIDLFSEVQVGYCLLINFLLLYHNIQFQYRKRHRPMWLCSDIRVNWTARVRRTRNNQHYHRNLDYSLKTIRMIKLL